MGQFVGLKQGPVERVNNFHMRCVRVQQCYIEVSTAQGLPQQLTAPQVQPHLQAIAEEYQHAAHVHTCNGYLKHFFMAGLRPEIRGQLLDRVCETHEQARIEANAV